MIGRCAALLLAAISLGAVPGASQAGTGAGRPRPGWLPRLNRLGDGARLTQAERAEVLERLEAFERILLQVDELAQPTGFEIRPGIYSGSEPGSTGNLIQSHYWAWIFAPTLKIAGEGCTCLRVDVNSTAGVVGQNITDGNGAEIFFEDEPGEAVPGATAVWSLLSPVDRSWTTVAFTTGGRSPWLPVTREAFLQAVLLTHEGENGSKIAAVEKALAETPYQIWLARAAERKAAYDIAVSNLPPAEAAKQRKQFEDEERKATEQLKAGDAADRAEQERTLATMKAQADRLRARIAALRPEERATPAWIANDRFTGEYEFVAPGRSQSNRIVKLDTEFFKVRGSRVAARMITVRFAASLTGEKPPVHNALWQAFRKLDWAAIARLVEPPR